MHAGQVCIAAKRIICVKSIVKKLVDLILNKMSEYSMGDPLQPSTQLGPLARQDLRENLHLQVENSIKQGAKLLCGGIIPEGKGILEFVNTKTIGINKS